MKKFVFEHKESDGFHYFITVPVFVEYESEEKLYIDVFNFVNIASNNLLDSLKKHSRKKDISSEFNACLYDHCFEFMGKNLPLEDFVYLEDNNELKIDFNIFTLEDYFLSKKLQG
jgi:hypothetical protein